MAERKRLTRSEAAAETRGLLLTAARGVFVHRGYEAASIYEIAETAGYTIGALYSQFGGKAGVFLALMDDHFDKQLRELSARLAADSESGASVRVGGEFWAEFLEREPELVVLFIEFWSASMRDEDVRERLAGSYHRLRSALAELVDRTARGANVELPASPTEVAIAMDALIDGFALHRLADPDRVPADLVTRALGWLVAGMANDGRRSRTPRR